MTLLATESVLKVPVSRSDLYAIAILLADRTLVFNPAGHLFIDLWEVQERNEIDRLLGELPGIARSQLEDEHAFLYLYAIDRWTS